MKYLYLRLVACLSFFLLMAVALGSVANAQMTVNFGEVGVFTGPDDLETLNFPLNVSYAIGVFGDEDREIKGVTFLTDQNDIDGYTQTFNQQINGWQAKPEFGDTPDDDNLEELMNDIRWSNTESGFSLDVTPNTQYTLQMLFGANHQETRFWDIVIEGELAVEGFSSLGESDVYSPNESVVYTNTFVAGDDSLDVFFPRGSRAGDNNSILSGIILTLAGDPVTPGDFNEDGSIDLADYDILAGNFLLTGVSFFEGDMTLDRKIGLDDFIEFSNVFQEANPGAVPEPSTFLLAAFAGVLLLMRRVRRS